MPRGDKSTIHSLLSLCSQRLRFYRVHRTAAELLTSADSEEHTKGLSMVIPSPEWDKNKSESPSLIRAAKLQAIMILKKYWNDDLDMYENMRNFIQIVRRLTKNDILKLFSQTQQLPEMERIKNK